MVINIVLSIIFTLWVVFTIVRQLNNSKIQNFDSLDLIPNCRFFAPKPLSKDYRIFSQVISSGDCNGQDVYTSCFSYEKRWYAFAWNPNQKIIKTVNDLCASIIKNLQSKNYDLPYFILLNMVNELYKHDQDAQKIRFVIVFYSGYENQDYTIAFQSNIHTIDRV